LVRRLGRTLASGFSVFVYILVFSRPVQQQSDPCSALCTVSRPRSRRFRLSEPAGLFFELLLHHCPRAYSTRLRKSSYDSSPTRIPAAPTHFVCFLDLNTLYLPPCSFRVQNLPFYSFDVVSIINFTRHILFDFSFRRLPLLRIYFLAHTLFLSFPALHTGRPCTRAWKRVCKQHAPFSERL
jgi:hypothetical protein